jgi:hypothetical protein
MHVTVFHDPVQGVQREYRLRRVGFLRDEIGPLPDLYRTYFPVDAEPRGRDPGSSSSASRGGGPNAVMCSSSRTVAAAR